MQAKATKALLKEKETITTPEGKTYRMGFLYLSTMVKIEQYKSKILFDSQELGNPANAIPVAIKSYKYAPLMARIVSCAIINNSLLFWLFGRFYAWKLMNTLRSETLYYLVQKAFEKTDPVPFTNSIVFLSGFNVTNAKATSPTGTGEKIAPGV